MKLTSTVVLAAAALAGCTNQVDARIGGWNGAAAQAAAMAISGFNGGTLNGPTSGGFRPPMRPIAPIHRPFDEDDELGWAHFDCDVGHYVRRAGTPIYDVGPSCADLDDDYLGDFRNPIHAVNRQHNSNQGYSAPPRGGRYDSAYYRNPIHYQS